MRARGCVGVFLGSDGKRVRGWTADVCKVQHGRIAEHMQHSLNPKFNFLALLETLPLRACRTHRPTTACAGSRRQTKADACGTNRWLIQRWIANCEEARLGPASVQDRRMNDRSRCHTVPRGEVGSCSAQCLFAATEPGASYYKSNRLAVLSTQQSLFVGDCPIASPCLPPLTASLRMKRSGRFSTRFGISRN